MPTLNNYDQSAKIQELEEENEYLHDRIKLYIARDWFSEHPEYDPILLENEALRAENEQLRAKLTELGHTWLPDIAKRALDIELNDIVWPTQNTRIMGILSNMGVKTVGELVQKTKLDLMCQPNCGKVSRDAIMHGLAKMGLTLKGGGR